MVVVVVGLVIMTACSELRPMRQALGLATDAAKLARTVRPRKRAKRPPCPPRALKDAIREADELARIERPTRTQRRREAELNAIFERDMRGGEDWSANGTVRSEPR